MNYSWQIAKFETRDQTNAEGVSLSNAVVRIKWRRSGVDSDGNVGRVIGYTNVSAEDVSEASFVPFESLTEETVINWLESIISESKMAEYNSKIQEKINRKLAVERDVPWS